MGYNMDEAGKATRALAKEYAILSIDAEYGEGTTDIEKKLRDAAKEKLENEVFEKVKEDIYRLEENRIIESGKRKIKEFEEQKKRVQLKFILIEGIFLGLITGLLVNQITDMISFLKGGSSNYQATNWLIVILLILGIAFAFVVYLSKLEEYFVNKKEKDNGSTI